MMGFNMISMQYSPQRKTGTIERLLHNSKSMFNRVPWDFTFSLYIGTRHYDDGLRIIEQFIPYFTPELNVRLNESDLIGESSDIFIILDDISPGTDAMADFAERRTILWTATFTLQGYLYGPQRDVQLIKKAIVDINDTDTQGFMEGVAVDDTSTVTTSSAYGQDDALAYHGAIGDATLS